MADSERRQAPYWPASSPVNLLVNGGFDADAAVALGWTLEDATVSIASGAAGVTATADGGRIYQVLTNLKAETEYVIAVEVNGGTSMDAGRVYTTGAGSNADVSVTTQSARIVTVQFKTDSSGSDVTVSLSVVSNGDTVIFDRALVAAGTVAFTFTGNDLDRWRHATDPTKIDGADVYGNSYEHAITGASHTAAGSAMDVVGLSGTDTLGVLTPDADVYNESAQKLLKADTDGGLRLDHLELGNVTGAAEGELRAAKDVHVGQYLYGPRHNREIISGMVSRDLLTIIDHFSSGSIPSGYAWAGTPFSTPSVTAWDTGGTALTLLSPVSGARAFLYASQSIGHDTDVMWAGRMGQIGSDGVIGLRFDDGTDNNYVEAILGDYGFGAMGTQRGTCSLVTRYRTGGGSVTEVVQADILGPQTELYTLVLRHYPATLEDSKWDAYMYLGGNPVSNTLLIGINRLVQDLTWTPARRGVIFQNRSATTAYSTLILDFMANLGGVV